MLGMGAILFCAVTVVSLFFYEYLKDLYIRETYQKTDLVLGHIDATMEYVRDELRPHMFHILPRDEFVLDAMSTSFVNKGIMERFVRKFPQYVYRRVATNPMNPGNRADAFEEGLIRKFSEEPQAGREWKGLVERGEKNFFIHFKAVVMEKQCEICHGDPSYAPKSLLARYGSTAGHYWKTGSIVGVESIAIPVDETFYQIRQVAFSLFMLGLAGMAVLFMVLNYFHYRVAVKPLKKASSFFKSVVNGQQGLEARFDSKGHDEIAELADSFNLMIAHLKTSQDERKEMEEKVRQTDKLASIGQLAAGVAHEINNPLSIVLGYTRLLLKDGPADSKTREDLLEVQRNARLCKKIVEDLLNFSRQTKPRYVLADINETVDFALSASEGKCLTCGVTVVRNYGTGLPQVMMDVDKMQQVYSNIIMNACQAMSSGGTLTLSTVFDRTDGNVLITFADSGPGIPEDILGRIFEPFYTTKEPGEGTGLGLAVSYGIVREHEGEILVESREGAGASFTVRLPVGGVK